MREIKQVESLRYKTKRNFVNYKFNLLLQGQLNQGRYGGVDTAREGEPKVHTEFWRGNLSESEYMCDRGEENVKLKRISEKLCDGGK